jgi:hypothetical protein
MLYMCLEKPYPTVEKRERTGDEFVNNVVHLCYKK